MTDEQLEKFVKERYEERTAFEVRPDPCNLAASTEKLLSFLPVMSNGRIYTTEV